MQPRGSAGYSTSGGGFDGFGYIDGFVPLFQNPEQDIWYLQGRGRLDNEGDLSGTMLFGYRYYDAAGDQVWGGYVGYDGRATTNNYFNQLGLGLELLGDVEVRLNGYLPIGDSRQLANTTSTSTSTPGSAITETTFSENSLLLGTGGGTLATRTVREFEAAVGGVDLEIGTRLADWEQGNLRGYAGIYYYNPAGADDVIGGRVRLETDPIPELNLGLSVSSDGLFGTNVTLQVGAAFGGAPQREATEDSNVALLGELVKRQSTLIIYHQTDVDVVTIDTTSQVVAVNPATNQPWRFVHVTGGLTGGSGTAEDPFGQVTNAVADIEANGDGIGDDIIYVQAGTNPGLEGFAVPDTVQVLSSGPLQAVDTVQQGIVTLPASGSGVLPVIDGTPSGVTAFDIDAMVALGNNTTLSGFDVQGSSTFGLLIQDASGATVVENRLRTTGDAVDGVVIFAEGLNADNVTFTNNTVATTGTSASGILFVADGSEVNNALIANNNIETDGFDSEGVLVRAVDGSINTTILADNTINTTDTQAQGIVIDAEGDDVNETLIEDNRINTEGDSGAVLIRTSGGNVNAVTVASNGISTLGQEAQGIAIDAEGGEVNTVLITDNAIETAGEEAQGILISTEDGNIENLTVEENRIDTDGLNGEGILVNAFEGDIDNVALSNNTIDTTGEDAQGIAVDASNGSVNNVTIEGNNLSTEELDSEGIVIATSAENASLDVTGSLNDIVISSNIVNTLGEDSQGIGVQANGGDINDTAIAENTIITIEDDSEGILIRAFGGNVVNTEILNNAINTAGNSADGMAIVAEVVDADSGNFSTAGESVNRIMVLENTINTTGDNLEGLFIRADTGDVNATVSDNAVTTTGNTTSGIRVQNTGSDAETVCIALSGNSIPAVGLGSSGIDFDNFSGDSTLFQVVNQTTLLTDNLFVSADPIDIETNDDFETVSVCP